MVRLRVNSKVYIRYIFGQKDRKTDITAKMRIFNSPTPSLHHAAQTVCLRTRSNGLIPLSKFATPLIPPYHGNPLLFNGHLQTVWTVANFGDPFTIHYARRHFVHPIDGGHFAVDFVTREFRETESPDDLPVRTRHMSPSELEEQSAGSSDSRPMLIALHGLSGGSHEAYLRAALHALLTSPSGGDWEACVINARGCAMSTISSKQLFNARWTADIREVVDFLRKAFPNRPLYAIGFSLGANVLTNYLGEEGEGCGITAAVACSNPWQLDVSHKALMRSWVGKEVYSKAMGANMRRLFESHIEQLQLDERIEVEAVRKTVHLHEFDRAITAKTFGYPTVGAYYRDASSTDNLLKVRVPMLVVHAKDDPIAAEEAVPYDEAEANPYVFMVVTEGGGHLSWFETGGGRWFAKPVCAPLDECLRG